MPAPREPSPPPRPRRRRSVWAVPAAGAAAIVVVAIAAARWSPGWYAERLAVGDVAAADRDARRLVTAVAGLRVAAGQPGQWGVAIREQELNAWLATDLPRHHAAALPTGVREPRVGLEVGRVRIAARVAMGPIEGLVSLLVEPRLRANDQLELAVSEARCGTLPIPAGPFVHRLASLFRRLGFATDVRRLDGRSVAVVSLGGRGAVLRGVTVDAGELLIAGLTEETR